jgi:hypothetical protein
MLEVLRAKDSYIDEETGVETVTRLVTAAELSVISKFLKDNHTTLSIEEDNDLGEIETLLANKTKKGQATLMAIDPEFEASK